jgi:signal transduction histidine kinase
VLATLRLCQRKRGRHGATSPTRIPLGGDTLKDRANPARTDPPGTAGGPPGATGGHRDGHAPLHATGILAGLAHDLGNSLTAVRLSAGALARLDPSVAAATATEYITAIIEAVDQMEGVVDDLRGTVRLETRPEAFEIENCSITSLLDETVERVQRSADNAGVRIETDVAVSPARVPADRSLIVRVLQRLTARGIAGSPRGERVRIAVTAEGGEVWFAITDSGPGFNGERMLVQLDARNSPESVGALSIDLALTGDVIRRHGGRFRASGEPGAGTTVAFSLPASPADPGAPGARNP